MSTVASPDASPSPDPAALREHLAGKYLTFSLAREVHGLAILKVQEIIGIMPVTRVPRTPEFVRGVINLRGKIIPVIDLRLQFGLAGQDDTAKTCIIVVQVRRGNRPVTMGVIVDEVAEVISLKDEQIEPPPSFGTTVNTDFLLGMGKVGQKVVLLLDIDQVLSAREVGIEGLTQEQDPVQTPAPLASAAAPEAATA